MLGPQNQQLFVAQCREKKTLETEQTSIACDRRHPLTRQQAGCKSKRRAFRRDREVDCLQAIIDDKSAVLWAHPSNGRSDSEPITSRRSV